MTRQGVGSWVVGAVLGGVLVAAGSAQAHDEEKGASGKSSSSEAQGMGHGSGQGSANGETKGQGQGSQAMGPGVSEGAMVSTQATVENIDRKARKVTLRTPSGEKRTINVSEDIQNLEQVKKGDRVNIQYYESVAVAMARPGEPSATVQEGSQPMADGTPGRMAGRQTTVTAEIVAVDPTAHTVTLKGPGGETKRVNVQRPDLQQKLKDVKPGQMVQITHTEAMAVSLEKQQK